MTTRGAAGCICFPPANATAAAAQATSLACVGARAHAPGVAPEWKPIRAQIPRLSYFNYQCSNGSTHNGLPGSGRQPERAPGVTGCPYYIPEAECSPAGVPSTGTRSRGGPRVRSGSETCEQVSRGALVQWRRERVSLQTSLLELLSRLQLLLFVSCAACACAVRDHTRAYVKRSVDSRCTCNYNTITIPTSRYNPVALPAGSRAEPYKSEVGPSNGAHAARLGGPVCCGCTPVWVDTRAGYGLGCCTAQTITRRAKWPCRPGKGFGRCNSMCHWWDESQTTMTVSYPPSCFAVPSLRWYAAARALERRAFRDRNGSRRLSPQQIIALSVATACGKPRRLLSPPRLGCGTVAQAATGAGSRVTLSAGRHQAISEQKPGWQACGGSGGLFWGARGPMICNGTHLVCTMNLGGPLESESRASRLHSGSWVAPRKDSTAQPFDLQIVDLSSFKGDSENRGHLSAPDTTTRPRSCTPSSLTSTRLAAGDGIDQQPNDSGFLRGADKAWEACPDSEWKTYSRKELLSNSEERKALDGKLDEKRPRSQPLYNVQRFPADTLPHIPASGRLREEYMRGRYLRLERIAAERAADGDGASRESTEKADAKGPRKLTWRDYLSWLPPPQPQFGPSRSSKYPGRLQESTSAVDDAADESEYSRPRSSREKHAYQEWEGFPPPPSTPIDELPLESLTWGNSTIFYRQAFKEAPLIIDEKTFMRLKSQWTEAELKRVQREEKDAYGIPSDVPDDCWIPISPHLPAGRLVQEYGLVPNVTLTAGGYDYIETYHDPARNYTWSYKRWNPLKQEGELPRPMNEEIASPYMLDTEQSRRYWHEEAHPPPPQKDDGIFRQMTLADEMIKGTKRTPYGMDQWHFTPTHPLGQAAESQNFWLTAVKGTLAKATAYVAAEATTAAAAVFRAPRGSGDKSSSSHAAYTSVSGQSLPLQTWRPTDDPGHAGAGGGRLSSRADAATQTSAGSRPQPGLDATPHRSLNSRAVLQERDPRDGSPAAGEPPVREEQELQRAQAAATSYRRIPVDRPRKDRHRAQQESSLRSRGAVADLRGPRTMAAATGGASETPTTHRSAAPVVCGRRSAYQPLASSCAGEEDAGATSFAASMKYRQLGKSGIFVSELGVGTMTVGSPSLDEISTQQLLTYAVDVWGVNFIDTAELYPLPAAPQTYGRAEEIIGRWLRSTGRQSGRKREEVVIATKVAGPSSKLAWLRGGFDSGTYTAGHRSSRREPRGVGDAYTGTSLSGDQIVRAAEGSLCRLQTDYIDLFQLHWPDRYVPMQSNGNEAEVLYDPKEARLQQARRNGVDMQEQLDAISRLLLEGKIRAWGLSNETPYGVCRFSRLATKSGLPPPASVQLQYNLLCRNDVEKGFTELARPQNAGIALLAYGALAGGILTGKYLEWLEMPTAGRLLRFPSYMKRYRGSLAARAVTAYYNLALRLGHPNLTVMALRWVLSRPFICSTLLGFTNYYQLRENLYCSEPACGVISDWAEREINFVHWKWRDPLRIIQ